eukprot:358416-Chlamydomonas_euryale.AAC.1
MVHDDGRRDFGSPPPHSLLSSLLLPPRAPGTPSPDVARRPGGRRAASLHRPGRALGACWRRTRKAGGGEAGSGEPPTIAERKAGGLQTVAAELVPARSSLATATGLRTRPGRTAPPFPPPPPAAATASSGARLCVGAPRADGG